jgi:hypothetical protein
MRRGLNPREGWCLSLRQMPVYYVTPYFLKPDKAAAFRDWLNSNKAKRLIKAFEKETGIKYIGTFFPVMGFGEYDAEDWYEMKEYGDFDKIRASKTFTAIFEETYSFLDMTHTVASRMYRSASDVKIFEPPKKKEK